MKLSFIIVDSLGKIRSSKRPEGLFKSCISFDANRLNIEIPAHLSRSLVEYLKAYFNNEGIRSLRIITCSYL